jgi:hypothetical protein
VCNVTQALELDELDARAAGWLALRALVFVDRLPPLPGDELRHAVGEPALYV